MNSTKSKIRLGRLGDDQTVCFAVEELFRCLKKMDGNAEIDILKYNKYEKNIQNIIWVGEDDAFLSDLPAVENKKYDDAIFIDVKSNCGVITGTNSRSILIAVYRFLKELGCAFIRPGAEGEIFPRKELGDMQVFVKEKASYRHRAICIEGSNSYEHIRNTVDFIPKVALGGYYIQYYAPFPYFDRWYSHGYNPKLASEKISREDAKKFKAQIEDEITKRSLLYHAVGHGWTNEPFGIDGSTLDSGRHFELTEENRSYLALVNGKREFWGNIPLATNLCYSNPVVRSKLVQAAADYCEKNEKVDYLHFWLGDGLNNMCECEVCRTRIASDYYVMMLNDLDAELTRRGIETKIVFLIYLDLMWTAAWERIQNQDRFALMFAPITRNYEKSILELDEIPAETVPYQLNQLKMPDSIEENIRHLKNWQSQFSGDSFDYDYHLMWHHYYDPGYYGSAKILFEDMQNLDRIGLNGMVSCQEQRVFFPTGLPIHMMASALWNKHASFEEEAARYFHSSFGTDGHLAMGYMKKLSELFAPAYLRGDWTDNDLLAQQLMSVQGIIEEFESVIAKNIAEQQENTAHKNSWIYLQMHAKVCVWLAKALIEKVAGNQEEAVAHWNELEDYLTDNELYLQHVLDVYEFFEVLKLNICEGKKLKVELV